MSGRLFGCHSEGNAHVPQNAGSSRMSILTGFPVEPGDLPTIENLQSKSCDLEEEINHIMNRHGAVCVGSGVGFGYRDLEYKFDNEAAGKAAVADLEAAGFEAKLHFVDEEEWREIGGMICKNLKASR